MINTRLIKKRNKKISTKSTGSTEVTEAKIKRPTYSNKSKKILLARKAKRARKSLSDRNEVYKIIARIHKELKNNQHVALKKLRGYQGEYDFCGDEITIDYRKELLPTLVHEFIHKFYPEKSESWVLKKESLVMRHLSSSQAKHLLTLLTCIV